MPASLREEILGDLFERFRRDRPSSLADHARWLLRRMSDPSVWVLRWELARRRNSRKRLEIRVSNFIQDFRFALRTLIKRPGFTSIAALTLGLGIGANAALVSVVRVVLLNPLPYEDSGTIVDLWSRWEGFPKTWVSLGEFQRYRDSVEGFDNAGLYQTASFNLTDGEQPERAAGAQISFGLLETLGVAPRLGREFTYEEARDELAVALLSDRLWRRRYGERSEVIGSDIEINGRATRVVGVLPSAFRLPLDYNATTPSEIYTPLATPEPMSPLPQLGGSHSYYAVARLAPGVSLEQARAELLALNLKAIADANYPKEWRFRTLAIPVVDDVVGAVRPALWVLLGAVAFVLWIACANVANLLLSQGHQRQRELAVRGSLGASRFRIARQLLTESFLVSLMGGAVGLGLASIGLRLLIAVEPGSVPRLAEARADWTTLLVSFVLATGSTLIAGLVPALTATRPALPSTLKDSGRTTMSRRAQRFRASLVSLQMAAAVVLVIGAGLMLRTFQHLVAVDPGFEREGVLTMRLSTTPADYPDDTDVIGFYHALRDEVVNVPGVMSAALVRVLPLATTIGDWGMDVDGYPEGPHEHISGDWQITSPGYFEAMKIPILEGRGFTDSDRADSESVIVINRSMAARFWPDESALGERIRISGTDDSPWCRVVGVVADVRHNGITAEVKDKWYRPLAQFHESSGFTPRSMTLVVRTQSRPVELFPPIRAAIRGLDARMPVSEVESLSDVFSGSVASSRFTMLLLTCFSLFATLLACVGVYGVVSYYVAQEQRGLGIRLALGATPRSVMGLVLVRGLGMSLVGIVVGVSASWWLSQVLETQLYGVPPRDPVVFATVPATIVLAALLGSMLPAFRAARVDPCQSLRAE